MRKMHLSDFDYDLPEGLIAKYPTKRRRDSRMLVLDCKENKIKDCQFKDFDQFLRPKDLLVFNNTKVIKARIFGAKETGGKVEILVEQILNKYNVLAQIRTSKRLQTGSVIQLKDRHVAKIITRSNGMYELEFSSPVKIFIDNFGELPIPPYLKRSAEALDSDRYQTIYAKKLGAVAAPTAGLHFDQEMFEQTRILNVDHAYITLHVGAGTYQPLKREYIEENKLHSEFIEVSKETCSAIANAQDKGGRVIAVGTTTVRAIEAVSQNNEVSPWSGETDIFIKPDYRFKTVNALLTNFHLPKSSLLLLVSAMAGKEMIMKAYEYAIEKKFRFYSYGDAMLIFPKGLS